jgi:predicted GIY-YIG superfamily endonuclease
LEANLQKKCNIHYVYAEHCETIIQAIEREKQLKTASKVAKILLLEKGNLQ